MGTINRQSAARYDQVAGRGGLTCLHSDGQTELNLKLTVHTASIQCLTNLAGYIIDNDGDLGTTIVHRSKAVVALLTSRVPDLEFHGRIIHHDGLC